MALDALISFDRSLTDRPDLVTYSFLHSFMQEEARALQGEAAQAKQEAQEALRGKDKARF